MNLLPWLGLTLLVLSADRPTLDQELDDEVSYLQNDISIQSAGFAGDRRLKREARPLGSARNPEAANVTVTGDSSKHVVDVVELHSASRDSDIPRHEVIRTFDPPVVVTTKSPDVLLKPIEVIEKKHLIAKYCAMPIAVSVMAIFSIVSLMERFEVTSVPEATIMIIVGMMLGIWAKEYGHFQVFEDRDAFGGIVYTFLNLVLLPIIIFTSGWSLRRQDFFSQFPYILLFAIVGVLLTASAVAGLIHWTGSSGLHGVTSWRAALAYGTLVSATDPVSVLVTYQKLKVDPLLNILVYGEATINDAVAIVLFHVLNKDTFMVGSDGRPLTDWDLVGSISSGIVMIFSSSAAIGIICACVFAFIAHFAGMHENKKGQILMIFGACYLTYALAESCGGSGIIANLFCGIISGIYLRPHLSDEGSLMATFFLQQVAMLADAAVFVLVGICAVQTVEQLTFPFLVMLFCLVGRAVAVFPLSMFSNFLKRLHGQSRGIPQSGWNLISYSHMFMIWHAGLRGGIALALSMELGEWIDKENVTGTRIQLQTATFVLVWVFLLVFGGSTVPILRLLGISQGNNLPPDHLSKTEASGWMRERLIWLDQRCLAPLLIGRHKHANEDEPDVEDVLRKDSKDGLFTKQVTS